jgi:gamma-glutamyltranspeptidase/glutathione hydrolase
VATNLTLGVVTPYLCGYGGDLFAIVWRDGEVAAYNGSGRAPAAATAEAVRQAAGSDDMPTHGPLAVTVPGAVEGWFTLLERFGTRPFADLASTALAYARHGFVPSTDALARLRRGRELYGWSREWLAIYGDARPGRRLRQPDLASTLETQARDGHDAYYRGAIGAAISAHLQALGGLMTPDDLAVHHGDWVEPLRAAYRGIDVLELPPNTQGVTALEALAIVERLGALPPEGPDRLHLLIEAAKTALADRDGHVTDPERMRIDPEALTSPAYVAERAGLIDSHSARHPPPGRPAGGGTAYLCTADSEGMLVSLIQSNYMGFGSGVTVPGWGINLQNRGAFFSLDPNHVNVTAPKKRTLHTLIPALALRDGRPWLVFGSMGGDGQAQIHLQLLTRIVDDGEDIQRAIDAPRWVVSPRDWSLTMESRFPPGWIDDLIRRGHRASSTGSYDSLMGHAHAIAVTGDGYAGATDPRTEGAVLGL